MTQKVFVRGVGAVSPAGWGVKALCESVAKDETLGTQFLERPGAPEPLVCREVPALTTRPEFVNHPRFRRTSPISQYAAVAAIEALGDDLARVRNDGVRLGVILCVMVGCVNYSRRFYHETLADPATASPLIFPETVFNAPASHIAALLGATGVNYTFVGDQGTFLQAIALGADWISTRQMDACLVVASEELDWMVADAFQMFSRNIIVSTGAGAVYLAREPGRGAAVQLCAVTGAHCFSSTQSRLQAVCKMRAELPPASPNHLLCDSRQNLPSLDAPETAAWKDWNGARVSPKKILGEGLTAAAAWQIAVAVEALQSKRFDAASVSVTGSNQQAVGAHFMRPSE